MCKIWKKHLLGGCMDIKETVKKLLQEMVVPDLSKIKNENNKILTTLDLTNKRLDDVNTHLADQSRRIDEVRTELGQRIDETNKRVDEVRTELGQRIDETNKRIDGVRTELGQRVDETNKNLSKIHSDLINRLDGNNARIDRFFQTGVTQTEHGKVEERVTRLERDVEAIRRQLAA